MWLFSLVLTGVACVVLLELWDFARFILCFEFGAVCGEFGWVCELGLHLVILGLGAVLVIFLVTCVFL